MALTRAPGAPLLTAPSLPAVAPLALRSVRGRLLVILADLAALTVAVVIAQSAGGPADARPTLLMLVLALFVFDRYRLFDSRHVASRREELGRVFHAMLLVAAVAAIAAGVFGATLNHLYLPVLLAGAVPIVLLERECLRSAFAYARRQGHLSRRVFIAGTGPEAVALSEMLANSPELGYRVSGFINSGGPPEPCLVDRGVHIPLACDVAERIRKAGAGGVMIAATDLGLDATNRLIRDLVDENLHVEVASSIHGIDPGRLAMRPLGTQAVFYVEPVVRTGWRSVAKRAFDIAFALTGLVLALPLLVVAAAAIKLTSRGPIIFAQERVGRDLRSFRLYKLRSMVADAEELRPLLELHNEADGPLFKMRNDPRLTRVGRIIRKFSFDEVPQLFNVLAGDMSVVGPRPALPDELGSWTPRLVERVTVKPGITGMWQLDRRSGRFSDYERLDLYYVENWSLLRDLGVVLRTIPFVLRGSSY